MSERSEATPEREPASDIVVRTRGLTDEEVAAVVSVVRASLEEELDAQDCGPDLVAAAARRWRHAMHEVPSGRREWR